MTKQSEANVLGDEIIPEMMGSLDLTPGKGKVIKMSREELMALPVMRHQKQFLQFLKEHSGKPVIISEKDVQTHKERLPQKFETWRNHHPNLTLAEALSLLLKDLPPASNSQFLIDILSFAIRYWEKTTAEAEALQTA